MRNTVKTEDLVALSEGKLSMAERQALVQRLLAEPGLAAQVQLAMRLAPEAQRAASAWVQQAARPSTGFDWLSWRRPAFVAMAATAMVAGLTQLSHRDRLPEGEALGPPMAEHSALSDQIYASDSFESGDAFTGGFERELL